MVSEMYQFEFDFRKTIKHNIDIAQLKTIATFLKSFRINVAKPELTLILLENVNYAKEQKWGQEFQAAMLAIRKQYTYNHVHNATLMVCILKELAVADERQHPTLTRPICW